MRARSRNRWIELLPELQDFVVESRFVEFMDGAAGYHAELLRWYREEAGLEEMLEWLRDNEIPHTVVATKIDRLPRGRRGASLDAAARDLALAEGRPIAFSARSGEGVKERCSAIHSFLSQPQDSAASEVRYEQDQS